MASCAAQEPVNVASNCSGTVECSRQALHLESVDILLVIANSGSIAPQAEVLKQQLPRMLGALTTGNDGDSNFPAAKSVHVAVTTADLSTGDWSYPSCMGPAQDGVFVRPGEVGVTCDVSHPGYLSFEGRPAAISVAESAACVPLVFSDVDGHNLGCGFEQPLEAALKSLWPSTDTRVQFAVSHGHGSDDNAGFLRADSLLVVVIVADKDDCSADDFTLYQPPNVNAAAPAPNLACYYGKDQLFGVQRYVDNLKRLRPDNDNVIFGLVAGVPAELVSDTFRARYDLLNPKDAERYYDAVLAHPLMQEVVDDPGDGTGRLMSSCDMSSNDENPPITFPPRRLVEVARGFGVNSVLGSLCTPNFGSTMGQLIRAVGEKLSQ